MEEQNLKSIYYIASIMSNTWDRMKYKNKIENVCIVCIQFIHSADSDKCTSTIDALDKKVALIMRENFIQKR